MVKGDYAKQRENANLTYGYSNAYLIMNSDEDYVLVEGDFVTQTYYSHEGRITAGTLEVKGDFIQKDIFQVITVYIIFMPQINIKQF